MATTAWPLCYGEPPGGPAIPAAGCGDEAPTPVPAIDDIGPYRLFFYSSDGIEPPHVHVRRDRATAKFWLAPVRLAASRSFDEHELRDIVRIVVEHETRIVRAWHEHFDH